MILRGRRADAVPFFCPHPAARRHWGTRTGPAAHPAQSPSGVRREAKRPPPVAALPRLPVPVLLRPALLRPVPSCGLPCCLSGAGLHAGSSPEPPVAASALSPLRTLPASLPAPQPAPRRQPTHGRTPCIVMPRPQHEKCIPINSGMDIFCDTVYCHKRTDKLKTTVTGRCGTCWPHGKTAFLPAPAERLPGDGSGRRRTGQAVFLTSWMQMFHPCVNSVTVAGPDTITPYSTCVARRRTDRGFLLPDDMQAG